MRACKLFRHVILRIENVSFREVEKSFQLEKLDYLMFSSFQKWELFEKSVAPVRVTSTSFHHITCERLILALWISNPSICAIVFLYCYCIWWMVYFHIAQAKSLQTEVVLFFIWRLLFSKKMTRIKEKNHTKAYIFAFFFNLIYEIGCKFK